MSDKPETPTPGARHGYRAACLEVDDKLLTAADVARAWHDAESAGREWRPGQYRKRAIFAALDKKEGK